MFTLYPPEFRESERGRGCPLGAGSVSGSVSSENAEAHVGLSVSVWKCLTLFTL